MGFFIDNETDVRIAKCSVTDNGRQGIVVGAVAFDGQPAPLVHLEDCFISNNEFAGIEVYFATDLKVLRTIIEKNKRAGVDVIVGGTVAFENTLITRNTINSSDGRGSGINIRRLRGTQLYNHSTVYDNSLSLGVHNLFVYEHPTALGVVEVQNSIVGRWWTERVGDVRASYSYLPTSLNEVVDNGGNIATEPTFANDTVYDLAAGSSGIDVSSPQSILEDDLDGTKRPGGALNDIGAQEFVAE